MEHPCLFQKSNKLNATYKYTIIRENKNMKTNIKQNHIFY
jgi:hypothetical protein